MPPVESLSRSKQIAKFTVSLCTFRSEDQHAATVFVPTTTSSGADADSASTLELLINQLENLTVKDVWTSHVLGQVKYYREKKDAFDNKADFTTAAHVMRWYDKEGRCSGTRDGVDSNGSNAIVLLAGANKGMSTTNILQACRKARMHIFEIQQKLFDAQFKRFRDSSLVKVHRKGWSDKVQQYQITLPRNNHEIAGLFLPMGKWKDALLLNETVESIPLSDFVDQEACWVKQLFHFWFWGLQCLHIQLLLSATLCLYSLAETCENEQALHDTTFLEMRKSCIQRWVHVHYTMSWFLKFHIGVQGRLL